MKASSLSKVEQPSVVIEHLKLVSNPPEEITRIE